MIWFGWVLWHISHYRLFNTKSYLYIYIKYKTLWKARWLFGKTKWLFRKLELHPGKTGILTNMDNTMKEKCPQGVCSGEGEYITHLTCSYGNYLDMYPATTCDCGRKFNRLRGTRIHKARWCEERNIADHQRPGDIFLQAKNLVAQG